MFKLFRGKSGVLESFSEEADFKNVLNKRVVAYFLDYSLIMLIGLGIFIYSRLNDLDLEVSLEKAIGSIYLAFSIIYASLTIGGSLQATLGMRALGLRVCTHDRKPPGLFRAVMFVCCFHITYGLSYGLSILAPMFVPFSRCLHDLFVDLYVVNETEVPTGPLPDNGPPHPDA